MYIRLFSFLICILLPGQVVADETKSLEDAQALMIERYVVGMGNVAEKKLSEVGLSRSDVEKIAAELSNTIRACITNTVEQQADATPSEVEAAEDKVELCVKVAFENAGIRFP